jgi:hypothetical protein
MIGRRNLGCEPMNLNLCREGLLMLETPKGKIVIFIDQDIFMNDTGGNLVNGFRGRF